MSQGGWSETLHRFIGVVRDNRVGVSVSETMDAYRAADLVGLDDPCQLKAALRTTLVKDPAQIPVFDELFDLYFSAPARRRDGQPGDAGQGEGDAESERGEGEGEGDGAAGGGGQPQAGGSGQSEQPRSSAGGRDMNELAEAQGLTGTARRIAAGDRTGLEIEIRERGADVGIRAMRNFWQEGFYTYRILEQFDRDGTRAAVRRAVEAARERDDDGAAAELEQRLQDFEYQVRDFVRRELRQRDLEVRSRFRRQMLLERSFYRASQAELKQIRHEVHRLAQKLKTRVALRRKRSRRGALHVQETIRANLQTGVVPYHLKLRRKHRQKPELVVFFDMSESVRAVSEFTLMFVHSLTDLFQRIRVFGFVADTAEVTDLMRNLDFDRAFREMMSSRVLSIYRHSDYGEAIRQLATNYGDAFKPRTTFIVLGDARSNYQPHEPELLKELVRKTKYSLWLNPEPRGSWGLGDSVMPDYARFFRGTATVGNLRQLEQVIEKLVLRF